MQNYSLSLIAPDELADKTRHLSEELGLNFGEYIPHVTLCWAGNEAQEIRFSPTDKEYLVQIEGFYCDVDDEGRAWVGLRARLNDELLRLRAEYAASSKASPEKVYFPHLTLGCMGKDALERLNLSPLKELDAINGSYEFTLHLCRNGEFGKVVQVIS